MIDARAVIDPSAELDEGVVVEPFAIIGADVKIGAGTRIGAHAVVRGPTLLGRDNRIFQFASVGEDPQDMKYAGETTRLEIGDRNRIREFVTIHRGTIQDQAMTQIGDDNLLMAYAHVAHDCRIGSHTILANAASLGGHVKIHDWAILGGFTAVHQFCRIGAHCYTGMGCAINKDVPPYLLVRGHPARPHGINVTGLQRRGFSPEAVLAIKRAYKQLYMQGLKLHEAKKAIEESVADSPELGLMAQFLRAEGRSILR